MGQFAASISSSKAPKGKLLIHRRVVMLESKDSEEMKAIAKGCELAFQSIVKRHQTRILQYCLRFLGNMDSAQDSCQEVFLTLWKERRRYRDKGKLGHYLLRIARLRCLAISKKNTSRRQLKQNAKQEALSQMSLEPNPTLPAFDHVALQKALCTLSLEHRDVLVLRYLEGMSPLEIHNLTKLSHGTVKSRIHRGIIEIRKVLIDEK